LRRLFVGVPFVVFALIVGTASPGLAAPVWTIQSTPNAQGASISELYGVACPGGSNCKAVGFSIFSGVVSTLVETWNGTKWSVQSSPNPHGAAGANLNAITCVSATDCTAVGTASFETAYYTLVERWDGTAWKIQQSPNPAGWFGSGFTGVTCTSSKTCVAVGISSSEDRSKAATLVERWNGSKWSIQTSPNQQGADISSLYGVSCPGTTCQAVGYSEVIGASTRTLAMSWNGSKWKIVKSANPGNGRASLTSLSCAADSLCTAAGSFHNTSGHDATLVETWNGSRWSVQKTPNPNGAVNTYLQTVACASLSDCTAVGWWYGQSGVDQTLAERWNGTKWSIESSDNPPNSTDSALEAVAYRGAKSRTAVGYWVENGSTPIDTLAEGAS